VNRNESLVLEPDPAYLTLPPEVETTTRDNGDEPEYPRLSLAAVILLYATYLGTAAADPRGREELLTRGYLDPDTGRPTADTQFSLQWYL
jgi:hypothetical protein